jgi:thioredoxin reductase (NADPH)
MAEKTRQHELVVIGAGPAGLAAAIYTTREDIETVLFEKGVIGGLAAITDSVENYPGFAEGVGGLELAEQLRKQAERFGARIELGEVTHVADEGERKRLKTSEGDVLARAVLIATGTDYRKLGIPGEQEFFGRGVHYCATCDGALFRDKRLVVVGGGNSAAQEGLFLTRFASHIDVLIRRDQWRASDILIEKISKHPKVTVHFNTTTEQIVGENGMVTKVIGRDTKTDKAVEFSADGVFVFVGLVPNTAFLKDSAVEIDERGFIVTDGRLQTKIPGVFAAGDVRHGATMQIASAVGEGATAALMIREYLEADEPAPTYG